MGNKLKWGERGKTISIYLSQEQVEILERAAKAKETSVSEVVRRAIKEHFFLPETASITKQSA